MWLWVEVVGGGGEGYVSAPFHNDLAYHEVSVVT